MDITFLYTWFHGYSQSFYSSDPEIMRGVRLKEDHSMRVAANSFVLAQQLRLGEREIAVAETAGLLHDVARHTQWTLFKSFNDAITQYDHGTEGAAILAATDVLNCYFSRLEQDSILFAITHHNKIGVPEDEPGKVLLANIIRDADKLDIFRTLPLVTADHDYSPALIRLLRHQRPLPYSEAKKPADRRLLRLGWLYDVNFDWTLQQLVSEGYADSLLSSLPDDDAFAEIKSAFYRLLSSRQGMC